MAADFEQVTVSILLSCFEHLTSPYMTSYEINFPNSSYSSSYSEKSRSIKAREIKEKAKVAELQAKIQFLEQRQRAENPAEALKVHEEMAGAKARMEVYKRRRIWRRRHWNLVNNSERMANRIKRKLFGMQRKTPVAGYQDFQIRGMQMKDRLL